MPTTTADLSHHLAEDIDKLMATGPAYAAARCTWRLVRAEGVLYTEQVSVPDYQQGPQGHCFEVSQSLAHAYPTLTYCEGYACLENGLRMEHAWNITPEGKVLDATWPEGVHGYLGIPLAITWTRKVLAGSDYCSVIFTDWDRGWELHDSGLPETGRPQRQLTFSK